MRILALDLATTTGYARIDARGRVRSGVLSFKLLEGEEPGARWKRVRRELRDLAYGCEWIVWEAVCNFGGPWARSLLFGLEVQVVEVAFDLVARTRTIMPASLKKFATGNGRAKKKEVVAAARKRWPDVTFKTHDQADAMWVLEWARKELAA